MSVGLASSFKSVPDLWHHRVGSTPDAEAMRFRQDGRWRSMTWGEAGGRVRAIGNGLLASGIKPEQRCVILAATSVPWILADFAILCAGAATTTIYPSAADAEVAFIVADCEAVLAFVDTVEQVERLRHLRSKLPTLARVVVFQPGVPEDDWVLSLATFERQGAEYASRHPEAYARAHRAVRGDNLATLMYTSGTTGSPKGVMLTHDAWVYQAEAIDALGFMDPADVQLLWLPLAHVFAKVLQLSFVRLGIPTVVDGSTLDLVANLVETRPTWFAGVPRTFEKAREAILARVAASHPVRRVLFHWAIAVGREVAMLAEQGKAPGMRLRARHALADRLVLKDIRDLFGGRLRFVISGAAPLHRDVSEFFHAWGLPILEGYGLTESSAASTVNRLDDWRFGTVGLPLPGCEVRIDVDGEILLRSRGLMKGYWRLPEDTAATFTEDGFLRTGDIGLVLPSGHVRITGRKKEIIVTAGGKNVAPANFEGLLRTRCDFVSHVVMHGDRRPFCSALITLDAAASIRWARDNDLPFADLAELATRPQVRDLLQGYIDAVNRELPSYEQVRRFAVLAEDFTLENGLLTPSLKVRRAAVEARYAPLLDGFYGSHRGHTPLPASRRA